MKRFYIILTILVLLSFLKLSWLSGTLITYALASLFCLLSFLLSNFRTQTKIAQFAIIFVAFIYFWHGRNDNIIGIITNIISIATVFFAISLKPNLKDIIIKWFLRVFAAVMGISLFFWILYLFNIVVFPPVPRLYLGMYELNDYLFFVKWEDSIFLRFQGLFVEPATCGLLCICALLLNDFRRDWKSLVFILCVGFSLSLAAYLILAFVLTYRMIFSIKKIWTMIFPVVLIFGVYLFGINYNGGDNIIYNSILLRMELDEDNQIGGYDRSDHALQSYYDKLSGTDLVFGIGEEFHKRGFDNSVDYEAFITLDGLVGFILVLMFYTFTFLQYPLSSRRVLYLMTFLIIFLRGFPFSLNVGTMTIYMYLLYKSTKDEGNIVCT